MKLIFKSILDNTSVIVRKGDTLSALTDETGRVTLLFIFEKRDQVRIVLNPFKIKKYKKLLDSWKKRDESKRIKK